MKAILLVGFGGALGSVLRYGLARVLTFVSEPYLPYATLLTNILGCFCMGICAALLLGGDTAKESYRLALMVGVLGGFTTFSAYSFELLQLINSGAVLRAGLYFLLSNLLALAAVFLGYRLVGWLS